MEQRTQVDTTVSMFTKPSRHGKIKAHYFIWLGDADTGTKK